ncbi:hypothetical protein BO70DRAFT_378397 [Aspergillus heteromorphus CBS 117.55]|uniref:Uncharacterized protein n=1 Tax=Aspergillus heteromorphus CBS 117.55 TaxID=1448321 RepID=A0A317WNA9_9EURO|nr:uncharacterized protein BO70DRAFT_378397 [Aspergillus heteromorphus CBS 117.55]PWY86732.1 hypothetical protein BO70DRAFT_378397 [Aspergillus heteromorphus CBS 117.55]
MAGPDAGCSQQSVTTDGIGAVTEPPPPRLLRGRSSRRLRLLLSIFHRQTGLILAIIIIIIILTTGERGMEQSMHGAAHRRHSGPRWLVQDRNGPAKRCSLETPDSRPLHVSSVDPRYLRVRFQGLPSPSPTHCTLVGPDSGFSSLEHPVSMHYPINNAVPCKSLTPIQSGMRSLSRLPGGSPHRKELIMTDHPDAPFCHPDRGKELRQRVRLELSSTEA